MNRRTASEALDAPCGIFASLMLSPRRLSSKLQKALNEMHGASPEQVRLAMMKKPMRGPGKGLSGASLI